MLSSAERQRFQPSPGQAPDVAARDGSAEARSEGLPAPWPARGEIPADPAPRRPIAAIERAAAGRQVFLSTLPAGRRERRLTLWVLALSTVAFLAAIPFAQVQLPAIAAFIPSYESALVIIDLITAVLLFGQFTQLRSRPLLALAAGYLFDALIIIPHALSFPGIFSPSGLLGAGPQTTAWLYVFWHGGFALLVLAYAVLGHLGIAARPMTMRPGVALACTIGGVALSVVALAAAATIGQDHLPVIIRDGDFSLLVTKGVSPSVMALSFAALVVLWRRQRPVILDQWIMMVLGAWLFDVALSAAVDSKRYDLGWYAGRSYGLLAASFVLLVLLVETNGLHRRLAAANAGLADRVRERTGELAHSNEALRTEMAERRQAQAHFVQAQKMEAIGNLSGGMAHDFNNLLGIIIGNLDVMRDHTKENADLDDLAESALDAALRGAELTRRLLAFARRQPLKPARIEVNDLVGGITKLLTRTLGEDVVVTLNLAPDLWPVVADPAQLEAALANLATNARDAMPGGGKLTIATGNQHLDRDYASQHPEVVPGDHVMIEVGDTGTGMPPDVAARIFEPFFTTKEMGKGTGLGLSMVFGFMKQSGGHINVYSEPGIGTAFRLYLPRADRGNVSNRPSAASPEPRGNGEIVLVVEDNAHLRRVVTRQVSELGYTLIEADNAAAALAYLEQNPVDLMFSDVVMPGKLNGIELARTARSRWPNMRVVLTSGFAADINGGTDETVRLLIKPYRKAELARALYDSLRA
jgi:signal transduction histidine kinase